MIRFEHVTKTFFSPHGDVTLLDNYSYDFSDGTIYGLYGPNGTGKSTFARLITGSIFPTAGNVQRAGNIVPFLELGVAFHMELSGRENIFVNGGLLGISLRTLRASYHEIIAYADLVGSEHKALKHYSSGMMARLAYSISRYADGDIFIFDEILAVGDAAFQAKCFENFERLKRQRKLIFIISHSLPLLEAHADSILMFNKAVNPTLARLRR